MKDDEEEDGYPENCIAAGCKSKEFRRSKGPGGLDAWECERCGIYWVVSDYEEDE